MAVVGEKREERREDEEFGERMRVIKKELEKKEAVRRKDEREG